MLNVQYRTLCAEEICRELFRDFIRHQIVTDCWRKEDGKWVIKKAPFVDDWTEKEYQILISCLKNTVLSGGLVCAAFCEGKLKGFVSAEAELFGGEEGYCDLSSIHVSADARGRGLGRALFQKAEEEGRRRGAEALYISAHSSVESQAFYKAMGCVEAREYQAFHVEKEPCDCQLERLLDDR